MDSPNLVKGISYLFYISLIAFFIFLSLLVVHYTYKPIFTFLPTNVIEKASPPTYASKTLYNEGPAPPDVKVTFSPAINPLNKELFTLSFDCYLNGTYRSTTVPRVLSYFNTSPVVVSDNGNLREYFSSNENEAPKLLTQENSDLLTRFQNTNYIVYIDPVKNDLKVGVFTVDKNDSTKKYLEIASVIENVPIKESFQITIVLGRTFIEVYKNKKLVNTYKIGSLAPTSAILNTTAIPSEGYGIFTPIGFIGDSVKIGNIQFYNGPLTSGQIRDLTNPLKPSVFFNLPVQNYS